MSGVYLDYNATAPVRPVAIEAVADALRAGGNPSSVHAAGRAARARIEAARELVADLVAATPANVIFTSGGTEANNLAISGAIAAGSRRLIVSAVEHPSVLEFARASGVAVDTLPVGADGVAEVGWLDGRLNHSEKPFVALMLANNETGVIQPVAEAAERIRAAGGWLHVDAVQAAGKLVIEFEALGADTLSISAHKLGGPQGIGALVASSRATITRRQLGGGQERGYRGGTENVSGIAGFGAAAREAGAEVAAFQAHAAWRDTATLRLAAAGAVVIGSDAPRLANTLCVSTSGWTSDLQVIALDLAGVMISAGAACSSGKVKASAVLTAMGLDSLADGVIRVSGGWASSEADWNRFADAWVEAHQRHTARRRAAAA